MQIRLYMDSDRVGPIFRRATERFGARVRAAMREAAQEAANEIEARGQDDIEESGEFGERWLDALKANVSEGGGNIRIDVTFEGDPTVEIAWPVFEYGAVIEGSPLLWIPFDFAADAKGLYARDYPAPLFRIDRKRDGLPILFAWTPGVPDSAEPKYFGKEQVTEPRKWHLREIIRDVAKEMREMYLERLAAGREKE